MDVLAWILASGLAMSAIALSGSVTLLLPAATLARLLTPLVAFAAGSLLGGAFFHMLPAGLAHGALPERTFAWTMAGFALFFALEQALHWHHCRNGAPPDQKPLTWLILIGDGLHNFLGGIGVSAVFLIDVKLGIAAWLAAAAHEVPQELGDFAVLVHGGWEKKRALLFNLLSGLMFLVGGIVTWLASARIDVDFLVPFAAGNFIYLGAADLVPEVRAHESARVSTLNFVAFAAGLGLLWWLARAFD